MVYDMVEVFFTHEAGGIRVNFGELKEDKLDEKAKRVITDIYEQQEIDVKNINITERWGKKDSSVKVDYKLKGSISVPDSKIPGKNRNNSYKHRLDYCKDVIKSNLKEAGLNPMNVYIKDMTP